MNAGILFGLGSALLFGASTPLAKVLVGSVSPVLLAGLLYLGAGVGLLAVLVARIAVERRRLNLPSGRDWYWLAGAILVGGVLGPVALMQGLTTTHAATASLLLNLEGVFTALLAWFVFRENFDRRIALGMGAIVLGGVTLVWSPGHASAGGAGQVAIVAACLCWAIDNNLTRRVSAGDAVILACLKGLVAGLVNTGLALLTGDVLPSARIVAAAAGVGFFGYGISLALFVLALRHLGTARAGAYFSVAPFFGAAAALAIGQQSISGPLVAAGALMAFGVWLHVTERHEHEHTHSETEHSHRHRHDDHHRHVHDFALDGVEPHTHRHRHSSLVHAHPHYPDLHHRHPH